MAVRTKAMWRDAGKKLLRSGGFKDAAADAGYFTAGLAMGAAELFSASGPFGIAIAAAAGTDSRGVLCLLGTVLGYLISGGVDVGVRYVATAFMVFTVNFALGSTRFARTDWFKPLTALAFTALTGFLYSLKPLMGVPGLLRLLTEVTLAGGCAYFFSIALHGGKSQTQAEELRHAVSFAVLCACGLMGLGNLEVFRVLSIGRFLSVTGVMLLGFSGGPLLGCAAGAAFGIAMDLARETSIFCAAAYGVSALAAGCFWRRGRLAYTLVFCMANAMVVLLAWNDGAHINALYECFAAAVLFMVLPRGLVARTGAQLRAAPGHGDAAFRLYQAAKLERVGDAFARMYQSVRDSAGAEGETDDASTVFDRASDAVCRCCSEKNRCWQTQYDRTLAAMEAVSEKMLRTGTLSPADLPAEFRENCADVGLFAAAVNGELRGMLYRRQYRARLRESRTAAYCQFSDVSEVILSASRELSGDAGPDPAAERRLGRYLQAMELEGVCSVFRDARGRLRAVIEGPDVQRLMAADNYLERLSEVLGTRLCLLPGSEARRLMVIQTEPLAVSVGIAAMKKEGEPISGDRGTYFKTDAGVLCVILSDGMGTGQKAAAESAAAIRILESLLRSGVDPGSAMRLLNAAALLKNGDDWGYATVDLCCVDLFTGDACFYKYGAAPSYIKSGRSIRRVRCTSVAAGMLAGDGASPDVIRMKLRPGNVALIASDGVLAEKNDQWLRDILDGADNIEAKEIARMALKAASERFGGGDDMTALVLRLEERP